MNTKIFICALLISSSASYAHHLSTVSAIKYSIQASITPGSSVTYDLTHGIVQYIAPDGTLKRYGHAHMARVKPATAQQIFGTIIIDLANELAGTWYIYR